MAKAQQSLNEFTDYKFNNSPKGAPEAGLARDADHAQPQQRSLTNTVIMNKPAGQDMNSFLRNDTKSELPQFHGSPVFNESSIAPADVSTSQIMQDPKGILNDMKLHGDTTNEYLDQTKQSSNVGSGPGKIIRSADGSPIKMHLDLSSILLKREME